MQYWVVMKTWEQYFECVSLVVPEWYTDHVDVTGEVGHLCLEFGKSCKENKWYRAIKFEHVWEQWT